MRRGTGLSWEPTKHSVPRSTTCKARGSTFVRVRRCGTLVRRGQRARNGTRGRHACLLHRLPLQLERVHKQQPQLELCARPADLALEAQRRERLAQGGRPLVRREELRVNDTGEVAPPLPAHQEGESVARHLARARLGECKELLWLREVDFDDLAFVRTRAKGRAE